MTAKIIINAQQLRRLKTVMATSEYTTVRFNRGTAMLISQSISFFKALRLTYTGELQGNFKLPNYMLALVREPGYIGFVVKDNLLMLTFSTSEKKFDSGVFKSVVSCETVTVPDSVLREPLSIIRTAETNLLHINDLSDIRDIIKVCSLSKVGIEISDGYIRSASNELLLYKKISDPDLKLGLGLEALKEIDKFSTDCQMHNADNHLLLSRGDFFLAVRKCVMSDIKYPPHLYQDSLADTITGCNIENLYDMTRCYKFDKNIEEPPVVTFDVNSSLISIKGSKVVFKETTDYVAVPNQSGRTLRALKFSLVWLQGLSVLKGQDSVAFYTYNNLVRVSLPEGINLMFRGEVHVA